MGRAATFGEVLYYLFFCGAKYPLLSILIIEHPYLSSSKKCVWLCVCVLCVFCPFGKPCVAWWFVARIALRSPCVEEITCPKKNVKQDSRRGSRTWPLGRVQTSSSWLGPQFCSETERIVDAFTPTSVGHPNLGWGVSHRATHLLAAGRVTAGHLRDFASCVHVSFVLGFPDFFHIVVVWWFQTLVWLGIFWLFNAINISKCLRQDPTVSCRFKPAGHSYLWCGFFSPVASLFCFCLKKKWITCIWI